MTTTTVLRGGNLCDVETGEVRQGVEVLVADGVIQDIGEGVRLVPGTEELFEGSTVDAVGGRGSRHGPDVTTATS